MIFPAATRIGTLLDTDAANSGVYAELMNALSPALVDSELTYGCDPQT